MNKTELYSAVAEATGETKALVEKVLNTTFFTVIPEELKRTVSTKKGEAGKIQVTGFGSFSTSYNAEREGKNPRNQDEKLTISAYQRILFTPGQIIKDIVNGKTENKKKETVKKDKKAKKNKKKK